MNSVTYDPRRKRFLVELTGGSGRLETRKGRIFTILMLVLAVFHFTSPITVLADHAEVVVVGSAGVIDEADLAKYEVRSQFATIKNGSTGTITYRYNLPATANFEDNEGDQSIRIRYRDTGANQNVTVRLRAARLGEDGVDTIYTFNSDLGSTGGGAAGPNINANQTFDECFVGLPADHITHGRYGYFLEVEITRSAIDGTQSPGLIAFVISDSGITDSSCGSVA